MRFTVEQTIGMLEEHEAGAETSDVCREHGISSATFCKFEARYGGMELSDARRPEVLEDEHARLKKLLAEQPLDNAIVEDVVARIGEAPCEAEGAGGGAMTVWLSLAGRLLPASTLEKRVA